MEMEVDAPAHAAVPESAASAAAVAAPTFSSSTEAKSKIVVEKRDQVTQAGLTNNSSSTPAAAASTRKELAMSNILLNRRLERNGSNDLRVACAPKPSKSVETSTAGVAVITSTSASDKIAISSLSAPKTLTVLGGAGCTFDVQNQAHYVGHKMAVHKLSCIASGRIEWEVMLSSPMVGCVATSFAATVACSDWSLHCFSVPDGGRLFPAVKLSGAASLLRAQNNFVLVVTTQGDLCVWDVHEKKLIVKSSLLNLLGQGKIPDSPSALD